jgi:hypothetical protein
VPHERTENGSGSLLGLCTAVCGGSPAAPSRTETFTGRVTLTAICHIYCRPGPSFSVRAGEGAFAGTLTWRVVDPGLNPNPVLGLGVYEDQVLRETEVALSPRTSTPPVTASTSVGGGAYVVYLLLGDGPGGGATIEYTLTVTHQ